jgi:hypothetical protein
MVELNHTDINLRFDISVVFTTNYFLVRDDVSINNNTLLMIDFMNLKIKLTQSFILFLFLKEFRQHSNMFFYNSSLPELRWRPFHMARCSKEDRTPARSCHFKKKKNCAVYGTHKQYLHFICVSVAHENQNVQHDYQISFHFPKNKISYFFYYI